MNDLQAVAAAILQQHGHPAEDLHYLGAGAQSACYGTGDQDRRHLRQRRAPHPYALMRRAPGITAADLKNASPAQVAAWFRQIRRQSCPASRPPIAAATPPGAPISTRALPSISSQGR